MLSKKSINFSLIQLFYGNKNSNSIILLKLLCFVKNRLIFHSLKLIEHHKTNKPTFKLKLFRFLKNRLIFHSLTINVRQIDLFSLKNK